MDGVFGLILGIIFIVGSVIRDISIEKEVDIKWRNIRSFFKENATRDSILEAHVCLAARMIQSDTKEAGQKVIYIHKYFRKMYPNHEYNFQEVLTECYREPVDEKSVARWLNRNIKDRSKKMQVMYFLAGLSHVDGSINGKEMSLLHSINNLLDLTPKEFQSVIGMYQQRYERKREPSTYSKTSARKTACKILGISETASMDEIKKAHRKLVKIHHPDRFVNESESQQELAEQRFLEIQKAYEIMEKK